MATTLFGSFVLLTDKISGSSFFKSESCIAGDRSIAMAIMSPPPPRRMPPPPGPPMPGPPPPGRPAPEGGPPALGGPPAASTPAACGGRMDIPAGGPPAAPPPGPRPPPIPPIAAAPPLIDIAIIEAAIGASFFRLASLPILTCTGFFVSRSITSITPLARSTLLTVAAILRNAPLTT